MSEAEAKALVNKADQDSNKGIDFSEFALLWEALHGESEVGLLSLTLIRFKYSISQNEFRDKFSKLDIDNSGYITKEEMLEVVASGASGVKVDEAKATIDQLDVDQDGKVSYPEFLLVMKFKK